MEPRNHEEHIRHSFDSYCKKVLKYKAVDLQRQIQRRGEHEVSFSELTAKDLAKLAVADRYFTDEYVFAIPGGIIGVSDTGLAEALNELPADRREIVLMSYFFDMTDKEIAKRLKIGRSTVAYKRTSTLQQLKKIMEMEE